MKFDMTNHSSVVGTVWIADDGVSSRIYASREDAEQNMFERCIEAVQDASLIEIFRRGSGTVVDAPNIASIFIDEIEVYGNPDAVVG